MLTLRRVDARQGLQQTLPRLTMDEWASWTSGPHGQVGILAFGTKRPFHCCNHCAQFERLEI